jgi:hypothetical protein
VLVSSGSGASADPPPDPIVGDWNVTYGAPTVVTMTLADGVYTETAKAPVRVTGGTCDLPPGTVIANFRQTGPGTYVGQHGLWSIGDCSFANWTDAMFTLGDNGNALVAHIGFETDIFTRIPNSTP